MQTVYMQFCTLGIIILHITGSLMVKMQSGCLQKVRSIDIDEMVCLTRLTRK